MKKTIILASALAFTTIGTFTTTSASAQTAQKPAMSKSDVSPADRAKQATDKINAAVQLTADQSKKVLEVNTDFFTQRAAIKTAKADDANTKLQTLNKDRDTKLKAILTPEQWQKWSTAKKEMHNEKKGMKGGE